MDGVFYAYSELLLVQHVYRFELLPNQNGLKNNDKETGCTIHLVTDEVDGGPIIIQKKCKVDSNDTIDSLKSKVQSLEGEAFLEAIPMFANNG